MRASVVLFVVVVLVAAAPLAGDGSARIRASPRMAGSPATVSVTVTVERRERNRALTVTIDSGDYYRSSELPLEGDKAPRSHSIRYVGLPANEYQIVGAVRTQTGSIAIARTSVLVTGFP